MLRFSYSQIEGKISCGDCDFRKECKKERFKKLPSPSASICSYFKKSKTMPEVKMVDVDYDQLIRQLSNWNNIAKHIINKHMMKDWFGLQYMNGDNEPTFSECEVFIKINNIFIDYLTEYKVMLNNSEAIFELLLQTVYSVDGETKTVKLYTEDKLLQERIEEYLYDTDYVLKEEKYEDVMGIIKNKLMRFIIF